MSRPQEVSARGMFISCWPFYGGLSRPRLARMLRPELVALAQAQGVQLLPGDPMIRLVRTGAGVFVIAGQPGVSYRPVAEVHRRAREFASVHEQAVPVLARSITKHLEEAA